LWRATQDTQRSLTQQEIDDLLELEHTTEPLTIPHQRPEPEVEAWSQIRTDTGDERWLNHLSDRHCGELL
jgi:hypothetical protein